MTNPGKHDNSAPHHVTPFGVYAKVFGSLICLTITTVAVSYMDFGSMNILIAMLIATMKALLVILFFMGLKYEGQENNVAFFCSFVFLSIFVGLTSSDLFYRTPAEPVKVDASDLAETAAPVDVATLVKPTPELVQKGHAIFMQQCIACHGPTGEGNGPAAAALVPHPRNFTKDVDWVNGRQVSSIFKTLSHGIQGSAMAAFTMLSPEDRLELVHYVRSLGPTAPPPSAEDVASISKEVGGPTKPHLPIEKAMDKMADEWAASHPGEAR